MRPVSLPTKWAVLTASCLLICMGFVGAGTLPPTGKAGQRRPGAVGTPVATPSPSPAPDAAVRAPLPAQSKRRDLARYDKFGPVSVGAEMSAPERDAVMARVRGFLLEHWRGRRLGHLVLNLPGPDGRPRASNFLIESDEAGRWCVVVETQGGTQTYRVVEEVELAEDGTPILDPTDEVQPRSGRRGLHLKESPEANSGVVIP